MDGWKYQCMDGWIMGRCIWINVAFVAFGPLLFCPPSVDGGILIHLKLHIFTSEMVHLVVLQSEVGCHSPLTLDRISFTAI